MTWLSLGLGAVALLAITGWLRERAIAREWKELSCSYMGAYCEVAAELDQERHPRQQGKQERRWLN